MQISNSNNYTNFTSLPKFQIKIDDKLVRGRAVTCPYNLYKMKKEGITQVIDLRNSSFVRRPLERLFCKILGLKYFNFKYPHRLNKLPEESFFEKINKTILNNDGKTYIHCQYGKRRTGISVAIYEKLHCKKLKSEVLEHLLNYGFQEIRDGKNTSKRIKLQSIYDDFIQKYYSK